MKFHELISSTELSTEQGEITSRILKILGNKKSIAPIKLKCKGRIKAKGANNDDNNSR